MVDGRRFRWLAPLFIVCTVTAIASDRPMRAQGAGVDHYRGEADHSDVLWLLVNYAAWHDLYVRRRHDVEIRPRSGTPVLAWGGV